MVGCKIAIKNYSGGPFLKLKQFFSKVSCAVTLITFITYIIILHRWECSYELYIVNIHDLYPPIMVHCSIGTSVMQLILNNLRYLCSMDFFK